MHRCRRPTTADMTTAVDKRPHPCGAELDGSNKMDTLAKIEKEVRVKSRCSDPKKEKTNQKKHYGSSFAWSVHATNRRRRAELFHLCSQQRTAESPFWTLSACLESSW